jgi:mannose-6-phosphate isomerase
MSPELEFTQPLIFRPFFMERTWGGRRLESVFGKKLPPGKRIGESWEIVDRPEAQSVVRQGPWRGRTLHELWREHLAEIFGDDVPDTPRFPILAKLLDAQEKLSLQVHPDSAMAGPLGGEPKTEMWYFAAADDGAEIYAGFRSGVTRDHFKQALREGGAADLVHRIGVKKGDAFFVPSGRLHAIGAGNLIIEIQQNSDTTFRLFDWGRGTRDGAPRTLQVEEALQSIAFEDFEPEMVLPSGETLVQCPHFTVEKWDLKSARRASERSGFALFVCLSGALEMNAVGLEPGEFFLVPAYAAASELQPVAAATSVLRITLPAR